MLCTISLINGDKEAIILDDMTIEDFIEDVFEGEGLGNYKLFTMKRRGYVEDDTIIVPKKNIVNVKYISEDKK